MAGPNSTRRQAARLAFWRRPYGEWTPSLKRASPNRHDLHAILALGQRDLLYVVSDSGNPEGLNEVTDSAAD